MVPEPRSARNFSAACRCRSSSSTHWPRSRTSGIFSRASSASSAASSVWSPTASSYRKSIRSVSPKTGAPPDALAWPDRDLVVSLSPSRDLRTQSGSSTPNPAPASSGPVSLRNCRAPLVSSSTASGAAPSSSRSSSGNSREARPRPASRSSSGNRMPTAAQPSAVSPDQMSAAGSSRLGSSVDWSASSTRQPDCCGCSAGSSGPAAGGSVSRKQVRTGPGGSWAASCQVQSANASWWAAIVSVRPSASSPLSPVSAASQRSTSGAELPRTGPGSRVKPPALASRSRTAASVSRSSTCPNTAADCSPASLVARQSGGMAAVSSRARSASAPASTGRQQARLPPSAVSPRPGRTLPRAARSAASAATAARYCTEPPATPRPDRPSCCPATGGPMAASMASAAAGSKVRVCTRQAVSDVDPAGFLPGGESLIRSGEAAGPAGPPGSHNVSSSSAALRTRSAAGSPNSARTSVTWPCGAANGWSRTDSAGPGGATAGRWESSAHSASVRCDQTAWIASMTRTPTIAGPPGIRR